MILVMSHVLSPIAVEPETNASFDANPKSKQQVVLKSLYITVLCWGTDDSSVKTAIWFKANSSEMFPHFPHLAMLDFWVHVGLLDLWAPQQTSVLVH